jgi:ribonuclease HI
MEKKKNKYYVVWLGAKPGIYDNWEDCSKQINGYPNAKYKGFEIYMDAEKAFAEGWKKYWGENKKETSGEQLILVGKPVKNSIIVDAAWNTSTLEVEYQGMHLQTKQFLFREGPFADGTNNVGEFLAIVHALAYCKKNNLDLPIYSDSRNAIEWVKNKHHRSKLIPTEKNKKLFELLVRAEKWLANNIYTNPILKWETRAWGENPADFGRK